MSHLALGQLRLDGRPCFALCRITEQIHDNGTLRDSLVDIEKIRARNPTILLSLLPRSAVLPHADDDIEAVIAEVQTLTVALGAVADERKSVILEVILREMLIGRRPLRLCEGQSLQGASLAASPHALIRHEWQCQLGVFLDLPKGMPSECENDQLVRVPQNLTYHRQSPYALQSQLS